MTDFALSRDERVLIVRGLLRLRDDDAGSVQALIARLWQEPAVEPDSRRAVMLCPHPDKCGAEGCHPISERKWFAFRPTERSS